MSRYNTVDYIVERTGERKYGGFHFEYGESWKTTIARADRAASKAEGEPCKTIILNGNAR